MVGPVKMILPVEYSDRGSIHEYTQTGVPQMNFLLTFASKIQVQNPCFVSNRILNYGTWKVRNIGLPKLPIESL